MAMRRGNGLGSVYKKKDRKRRKPYNATVTVKINPETGKQIKKSLGYFATQKEALEALDAYHQNPNLYLAKDITFEEVWKLMIKQKENLGVSSAANYNMTKNRCTHLLKTPIQDIRLAQLQDIIDTCGLSAASKRQIKVTLNAVFSLAYANDYIKKNYAELIKLPPLSLSDKHKPFTESELGLLWSHQNDEVIQMILCYCYTGARPIELLLMAPSNVFLKDRYMIGGVKTEAGKDRKIPIADCIYPFIKAWYTKNAFNQYLFPINSASTFRYKLNAALDTYNILSHKPHDGRHTFITMASNYGIDEVLVKRIVGHSRGRNITQDVYTHKTQEQLLEAVNSLPYGPDMNQLSKKLVGAIEG